MLCVFCRAGVPKNVVSVGNNVLVSQKFAKSAVYQIPIFPIVGEAFKCRV